jgi:hypothetical protein
MMFRRLQKQLHDTELGTGSGTTGTRTVGLHSHPGETRVTMKGFVEDMLLSCGITGGAKTPATDGLF